MVEYRSSRLSRTYAALANPSRRAILERLQGGELRVTEIARPFRTSLNAVSKHLKVLEQAGLVQRRIRGRSHYFAVDLDPLSDASAWLEQHRTFWEARLDALEAYLKRTPRRPRKSRHP